MNYRNKILIYEIDDERVIIDTKFNGLYKNHDYVIFDIHTLAEEISEDLATDREDVFISEVYDEVSYISDKLKDDIINEIVDYFDKHSNTPLRM